MSLHTCPFPTVVYVGYFAGGLFYPEFYPICSTQSSILSVLSYLFYPEFYPICSIQSSICSILSVLSRVLSYLFYPEFYPICSMQSSILSVLSRVLSCSIQSSILSVLSRVLSRVGFQHRMAGAAFSTVSWWRGRGGGEGSTSWLSLELRWCWSSIESSVSNYHELSFKKTNKQKQRRHITILTHKGHLQILKKYP